MRELNSQINKLLKNTLNAKNNEVANTIKITQSMKVEEEVYNKYVPPTNDGEPWIYQRRRLSGRGLSHPENMKHEAQESGGKVKMVVVNLTPANPEYNDNNLKLGELAQLVEGGHGANGLSYSYPRNGSGSYAEPRPFQQKTVEELARNKEHVQALESELRSRGLDVKRR